MPKEPLMKLADIAEYIGESERWIRREGRAYGLPLFKTGRNLKARASELDAWLEQQRVP